MEAELPPERDSPAAQAGSEPQVSHEIDATIHSHPDGPPALLVGEEMATPLRGGTTSSNPSCSAGESVFRSEFAATKTGHALPAPESYGSSWVLPREFVWPAPARCRSAGRWRPRIWPGPPSAGRVFASSQALLNSLYEQTPPRRIDIKGPRVCRPAAGGNGISNPLAPLASRLSHSGIEFGEMRRGEFGGGTWSRYRHRRANKGRPTRTWVRG